MRAFLLGSALLLSMVAANGQAAGAAADVPKTAAAFIARCEKDPGFCTGRILRANLQLRAAREACVPNALPPSEVGEKVVGTLSEVVEEAPEQFKEGDYEILIRQIMVFLWPCDIVS